MRFASLVLCVAAIVSLASCEVANLTDANFQSIIPSTADTSDWLVMFVGAKTLGWASKVLQMADKALDGEGSLQFGRMACTPQEWEQCQRFEIQKPCVALISPSREGVWIYLSKEEDVSQEVLVQQIVEWVKDGHHKDPMAPYPAPIPPRGPHFVAELTNDNFTVAEAAPETWVVNFYSPECGHCRLFERPYEELSVALHDNGGLRFGRVNCRRDEVSCKRYGINSWPTVCVIRDGMYFEYDGDRSVEALTKFVADPSSGPLVGGPARVPAPGWGWWRELLLFYNLIWRAFHTIRKEPAMRAKATEMLTAIGVTCAIVTGGFLLLWHFCLRDDEEEDAPVEAPAPSKEQKKQKKKQ